MPSPAPRIPETTPQGHTVIAVPVWEFNDIVRERTAYYDDSFVSTDPDFCHAHITLLAPWIPEPTPADLAVVTSVIDQVLVNHPDLPRHFEFTEVEEFVGGVIHLPPRPDSLFRALTAALREAFPAYIPYDGEFLNPTPHLTLDHPAGGVTLADVATRVAPALPVRTTVTRVDLQWWANNDCRLLHSWPLGD